MDRDPNEMPTNPSFGTIEASLSEDFAPGAPRRVFQTSEYEELTVPYDDLVVNGRFQMYEEVIGRQYFTVFMRKDRLVFQAGNFVGLIPINERVAINVRPRVPVSSLERLLRIANASPVSLKREKRTYALNSEPLPSLLDVLAAALIDSVELILANGLHREYRRSEADTSFPRGRIMLSDTVRRHQSRGIEHRVTASWFERTGDTGPNRCVRFALHHLAHCYPGMAPTSTTRSSLRALNRLHQVFSVAKLDPSQTFLDDPIVREPSRLPGLRAYYEQPLHLAKIIIQGQGISFGGRDPNVVMPSLVVNLEKIFEDYVRAVLRDQFRQLMPDVVVLDGNHDPPVGASRGVFDGRVPGSV